MITKCVNKLKKLSRVLATTALYVIALAGLENALHIIDRDGQWARNAHAEWAGGHVMARNIVRGPNGQPIFAEFDTDGEVANEIGEAVGRYRNAYVISGDAYRAYLDDYQKYKTEHENGAASGAYLLTSNQYESHNFTYKDLDGTSKPLDKPALLPTTKSVFVRSDATILTKQTNPILLQSGINLATASPIGTDIRSVLLTENGDYILGTQRNIGFRTALFKNATDDGESLCYSTFSHTTDQDWYMKRVAPNRYHLNATKREWDPCGPIVGAIVSITDAYAGQINTMTDFRGWYQTYYTQACYGNDTTFTHIMTQLYYRTFNPKATHMGMYYHSLQISDWCFSYYSPGYMYGMGLGPVRYDPKIDVLVLSGRGFLSNFYTSQLPGDMTQTGIIPMLEKTAYNPSSASYSPSALVDFGVLGTQPGGSVQIIAHDYNDDGIDDVGYYFGGKDPSTNYPDLVRQIDSKADFSDRGLVSGISTEDMKNTDIYIYRVSNGQLITEHKGLDSSVNKRAQDNGLLRDDFASFYYRSTIRGEFYYADYFGDWDQWQSDARMNPAFHDRKYSDHLRVGEQVKVIAINRLTGYMGSVITTVANAATNTESLNLYGGTALISFPISDIIMHPPNLKIKAERRYTPNSGITADNSDYTKDYLIGFEGAATTKDEIITIKTEWVDQDGTPLPNDLPGFTGRLAKVGANKNLSNSGLVQFDIKPGTYLQVVRLGCPSCTDITNDHYYIHVNAQPSTDTPNFSRDPAAAGILQYRPKYYVPFKVPVYDEVETRERIAMQRTAEQNGAVHREIEPVYHWPYRPELQFSVVDLEIKGMARADHNLNIIDIWAAETDNNPNTVPGIASSDQAMAILFDLDITENQVLDLFGGYNPLLAEKDPDNTTGRDFVLALGEEEALALFKSNTDDGENTLVQFNSLSHIAALDPNDYLTMSLYQNSDSANILWEYVMGILPNVAPLSGEISADNPHIDLTAYLPANLDIPENESPANVEIQWIVEGPAGSMQHTTTSSTIGIFPNRLTTSTKAGDTYYVNAKIISSEDKRFIPPSTAKYGPFEVVPGSPFSIDLSTPSTNLLADGVTTTTVKATVYDKAGNLVADGTPIDWSATYGGEIIEAVTTTTDGVATATYKTSPELTATDIIARSANAEQSITITKQPFDFTLVASAPNLTAGTGEQITLTVTASETPAAPVPMFFNTTRGEITGPEQLSGNTATFTLSADKEPGESIVGVSIAGVTKNVEIYHAPNGPGAAELSYQSIVAAPADSSTTIDTFSRGQVTYANTTETTATVYGVPNTSFTLMTGGFFTPNSAPTVYLPMYDLLTVPLTAQRYTPDHMSGMQATVVNNVQEEPIESYTKPGGSLRFFGGYLQLAADPALDIADNLFLNIRFHTQQSQDQTLIRKGTVGGNSYKLALTEDIDGLHLSAEVTTANGTYTVTSDSIINPNQWYIAGIRVRNGQLQLGINAERKSVAIDGPLINLGFGSVTYIGEGFRGFLDEIKIGRDNSQPLVALGNDSQSQTVTIGADGTAAFTIKSTDTTAGAMQRVGFSATYTTVAGNVETKELKFAQKLYHRLTGLPGIDAANAAEVVLPYESGVAKVSGEQSANAMDMLISAGAQVLDVAKSAAMLLYEISGLADAITIGKAMYLWMNGRWDEVNKFDLAFAGIGLTLSIVAVITSPTGVGAGAALSLKAAMKGLKATLKELVSDPVFIIKILGTTIRYTFDLMVELFKGNKEYAVKQLKELGETLTGLFKAGAAKSLALFTAVVRSTRSLKNFIALSKVAADACLVPAKKPPLTFNYFAPGNSLYAKLYERALYPVGFVVGLNSAEAAPASSRLCGSALIGAIDDARKALPLAKKQEKYFNTLVPTLRHISNSGTVSVNTNTLVRLRGLIEDGHGEYIEGFIKAVAENRVVYKPGEPKSAITDWYEAAVVKNKNAPDSGVISSDSVFDKYIENLYELSQIPSNIQPGKIMENLRPRGENSLISSYQYKHVFGDMESLKTIKGEYPTAQLESLNDRVRKNPDNPDAKGIEGVDSVWTGWAPGRGKLYVESKNWGDWAIGSNKTSRLETMENQFIKHMQENVGKNVQEAGRGGLTWKEGMPRLQYVLTGSFFQAKHGTSASEMFEKFKNLVKSKSDPPFDKINELLSKDPGFDANFADLVNFTERTELVPPFSN
jgi:hypothetical protein